MNYRYSDQELKKRLVNYIEKTEEIMDMIDRREDKDVIREEYKKLKTEIREEAHRVDLLDTRKRAGNFENAYYRPSIMGASAWGFSVNTNANVDIKMYLALEEARYRLTKYIPFNELKEDIN